MKLSETLSKLSETLNQHTKFVLDPSIIVFVSHLEQTIGKRVESFGIPTELTLFLLTCGSAFSGYYCLKNHPLLTSQTIGVLYPAYRTIVAIERPREDDDERWMTYWSVFGFFCLLDHLADKIKRITRVYYLPKIALLLWLMNKGSLYTYRKLLRPMLKLKQEP
ncbi:TB2/DP1, HVA22 family-domain-containing protein, partial [Gorgonomyces haynaldii]